MPEETITLRAAAQRLARIRRPQGTGIESSRLLSLLRSGELKAGFYFFRGTLWIEIPLAHWRGIDSNKFRIGRNPDDPKSGTYRVNVNQFAEEVARTLWNNEQTGPSREAVTAVINETTGRYEVTVKTEDFQEYLRQHHLKESTTTTDVGRRQKESWRDICSYMAAYMAAHYRDLPGIELKVGESSVKIVDLAKAGGVGDPPVSDTIKEQVSKAKALLETPKFNLKK
jgi:hypothetical protein